jgi:hypothetical protein
MPIELTRFLKNIPQMIPAPSTGELLRHTLVRDKDPRIELYLHQNPETKVVLDRIDEGMEMDFEAIQKKAYYMYLERMRRGEQPLHGRDQEDWFEAEATYNVEVPSTKAA